MSSATRACATVWSGTAHRVRSVPLSRNAFQFRHPDAYLIGQPWTLDGGRLRQRSPTSVRCRRRAAIPTPRAGAEPRSSGRCACRAGRTEAPGSPRRSPMRPHPPIAGHPRSRRTAAPCGWYFMFDQFWVSSCHHRKNTSNARHSRTGPAPSWAPCSKADRNIAKFSEIRLTPMVSACWSPVRSSNSDGSVGGLRGRHPHQRRPFGAPATAWPPPDRPSRPGIVARWIGLDEQAVTVSTVTRAGRAPSKPARFRCRPDVNPLITAAISSAEELPVPASRTGPRRRAGDRLTARMSGPDRWKLSG